MKLPELFLNQMRELLGAEYEAFEKSLAFPGYRGLRVNTSKTDTEAFQAAAPFPLERIPWIPNGFYLEEEAKASLHPWYAAGLYYLQEPSAM
ncbi:MAG: SAM-dependent methyltransferase, partial [Lachnospiraceae bacterium]|nr:SAM-dependent methyltransferase [Lachnospiraceae bacterium]